jgi:hypothetical protein
VLSLSARALSLYKTYITCIMDGAITHRARALVSAMKLVTCSFAEKENVGRENKSLYVAGVLLQHAE